MKDDMIISEKLAYIQPDFLTRNAIKMYGIIILFLSAFLFIVKSPEIITVQAKVVTLNGQAKIVSHSQGRLTSLLVRDSSYVHKGQIVGFVESLANPTTVLNVKESIDTVGALLMDEKYAVVADLFSSSLIYKPLHELGELQVGYKQFVEDYIQFSRLNSSRSINRQFYFLKGELNELVKADSIYNAKRKVMVRDLYLSERTFKANETLAQEKVLSPAEFRVEESKFLNKQMTIDALNIENASGSFQKLKTEKEIYDLEIEVEQSRAKFIQSLHTFQKQINEWLYTFSLCSPSEGFITSNSFLFVNQEIQKDNVLFYVNPKHSKYFIEMKIPQFNSGRVQVGDKAYLKLLAYPYQEFGQLEGRIESIKDASPDQFYFAKMKIDGKINRQITLRNGQLGSAEIITQETSLFRRIFSALSAKADSH